jgi:hypothetical protein
MYDYELDLLVDVSPVNSAAFFSGLLPHYDSLKRGAWPRNQLVCVKNLTDPRDKPSKEARNIPRFPIDDTHAR